MLLTRCPACHTTFRVTAEALQKAGGRVRCGRCATVFDANAALREEPDAADVRAASGGAVERSAAIGGPASAPADAAAAPAAAEAAAARRSATDAPPADGTAPVTAAAPPSGSAHEPSYGGASVADLIAQIERGGDAEDGARSADLDASAMSAVEIDAVLDDTSATGSALVLPPTDWSTPPVRGSRWWSIGAALAIAALAVQAMHHFRNDLAAHESIGPIVQRAYAALGAPLSPRWNVAQYQILDWIATAEPNANGQGSLRIKARVHNRGPRAQPYPLIHLELEDRRQETVGSRVFRPSEYLATRPRRDARMAAGATADAELEVVDPGPDAYGFELDVCIEVDKVLRCSADRVFQ